MNSTGMAAKPLTSGEAVAHEENGIPWVAFAWFGLLVLLCYAPVLRGLWRQYMRDPDMGHAFFVPVIAGFIAWQRRDELAALKSRPSWWGLSLVILGGMLLIVATVGVELFLSRMALLATLVGVIWMLGGSLALKKLAFPLCLLLLMIPIPEIVYNRLTFPLQILASELAESALMLLGYPVSREGNVLELTNQRLSVIEACSGIRSLLSLTFLAIIYAYFFEKKTGLRVALFLATVPIAIIANASRVTLTGILGQIKPELAEGFFHESTGWVIFMVALVMLVMAHQAMRGGGKWLQRLRRTPAT